MSSLGSTGKLKKTGGVVVQGLAGAKARLLKAEKALAKAEAERAEAWKELGNLPMGSLGMVTQEELLGLIFDLLGMTNNPNPNSNPNS